MGEKLGLYIHVPFCQGGKCPYCDFYSVCFDGNLKESYIKAVRRESAYWSLNEQRTVDTIYFGGGTPSLLGDGLKRILSILRSDFPVEQDAEITFEANPATVTRDEFFMLRRAGFNRVSLGMQSASRRELAALGRRHTPEDTAEAVRDARDAGFENVSLDLMLCVPGQTIESAAESVRFAAGLEPEHISAYLLKIEPGTVFEKQREALRLPDDDAQGDTYLAVCEMLEQYGYAQYEISNFSRAGRESRHNLKYWNVDDYLGLGPGAHSLINGRRFYYPRDLEAFLQGKGVRGEGQGGALNEYIMLRLRLSEGLLEKEMMRKYHIGFDRFDLRKLDRLGKAGYLNFYPGRIHLTRLGFLLSNSVISELLF